MQIRGYADQDLRNKQNPTDPGNRRVTLIVRYLDAPKQIKLGAMDGKVQTTEQHPATNPGTSTNTNPPKAEAPHH